MRDFHIPLAMSLLLIFNAMSTSAQDDNSAAMLLQKGDSCLNIHDNYHAMQYYLACANSDSTNITAHRKLALCYRNMGNSKACIESLARIPEDSISHEDARIYYQSFSLCYNDIGIAWCFIAQVVMPTGTERSFGQQGDTWRIATRLICW